MNPSSTPMSEQKDELNARKALYGLIDQAHIEVAANAGLASYYIEQEIKSRLVSSIEAYVAQHTKEAVERSDATNELLTEYFRLKAEDKAIRAERNEYMAHNHCLTEDAGGDCISKLQESIMGYTLCDVCERRNDWFMRRQTISHKRAAIMRKLKRLVEPAAPTASPQQGGQKDE